MRGNERKKENALTTKLRPGKSVFRDRGEEKMEEIKNEINEGGKWEP